MDTADRAVLPIRKAPLALMPTLDNHRIAFGVVHLALHLPERIPRRVLRKCRKQHHRLLPNPFDDNHMKQSVRDVRKPHRNDPELNGYQSLFAMMIEWYDFPEKSRDRPFGEEG